VGGFWFRGLGFSLDRSFSAGHYFDKITSARGKSQKSAIGFPGSYDPDFGVKFKAEIEMAEMTMVADRISLIPGRNQARYPYCHSLLVEDELTVLIDPASDENLLKNLAISKKVDAIVLSHYHEDHFWFSYLFPQAQLWAPEPDAPAMESLDRLLDEYRMEGERREVWRKILIEQYHYQARPVSRRLKEGDRISLGKMELIALHTPGHTPGHSCFYFPDQDLVYLSDIDLTRFGPWYGDRGSDIDQTIQSVKRVSRLNCRTFVVSHEQALYFGNIQKPAEQYLRVIDERDDQLRALLTEPRTLEEIVAARIIYKKPREPKDFYEFGEWSMITKHLERMIKSGQIVRVAEKYRLVK